MSVLVKGMKMPNNCYNCPFRLGCCRKRNNMDTRPFRCPLIEVPQHGRLIDADELMTKMIEYGWHHPDSTVHEFVEDELHTVIPADKDGET